MALPAEPVCLPAPPETYAREIAALPAEQKLIESGDMEVCVARDKIVTNVDEYRLDVWMTQMEPGW